MEKFRSYDGEKFFYVTVPQPGESLERYRGDDRDGNPVYDGDVVLREGVEVTVGEEEWDSDCELKGNIHE